MANEPGRIVAPDKGSTIDLTQPMWEGFVAFCTEHYDYLKSGTQGQQELAKQLTDRNLIQVGSRQESGSR